MILIDTHIWLWWANGDSQLPDSYLNAITTSPDGVGISAISCWEVAKKVEKESVRDARRRTIVLERPIGEWMKNALRLPRLTVIPLSPAISLESTILPGGYNMENTDPSDQIIIATARVEDIPLMTFDTKIVPYLHVKIWSPPE